MVNSEIAERFLLAFESIAESLKGLNESGGKTVSKIWPETSKPREAVITRVPNEEDIIRENQGASSKPIEDWLSELGVEPFVGEREREFLEEQKRQRDAGSKAPEERGSGEGSAEEAASQG